MLSDEERRVVARMLRGIKDTREMGEHDMCCNLWSAIFDSGYRCTGLCDECEVAVLDSIADLIEPRCDRDALLRLARYMDKDVAETEAYFSNVISTKSVSDYARRIRKALGVES